MAMLELRNLHVSIGDVEILKGIDLEVNAGEVHAIMGPNGSGKSTLALALAGHPLYRVTAGELLYAGESIRGMAPEERARLGLFLSFQNPLEISGVRLDHFLRAGVNEIRRSRGGDELDVLKFDKLIKEKMKIMEMEPGLAKRSVNEGFSGGEKKRSEILQMALLEPKLAILDETDSGLDVDALRTVAQGINRMRSAENAMVLVTHYQRILSYVTPDYVHVLMNGRIARSGGKELALEVETRGYDWIEEAQATLQAGG
jgi:Fe-S cluster assembly ATP-binding protein